MDPEEQAQKMALFYATIAASQSPGHLGYVAGINTIKEARSLVPQAIRERKGRFVKTGEDLVVACFPDAAEALKVAIAIQRNAVENRDKRAPLNVRIFIHFGEGTGAKVLQRRCGDFAARASDITKPGHVYVSTEAYGNAQGLNAVEFKPLIAGENARQGQLPYYDIFGAPKRTALSGGTVSAQSLKGAGSGSMGTFLHGAVLLPGPTRHVSTVAAGSTKRRPAPPSSCLTRRMASNSWAISPWTR